MDSSQQQQQNQEGYAASQQQDYEQSYYNNYYQYYYNNNNDNNNRNSNYTQQHDPYQQYASYYNTHYVNSHQNPPQPVIPHPPSSTPPPGVSAPPHTAEDGGGGAVAVAAEAQVQSQQQSGFYHGPMQGGGEQQQPLAMVPPAMNPVMAAAAAVVLAQFAGSMGAGGPLQGLLNAGAGGGLGPGLGLGLGPMRPPPGGGPFHGTARGSFGRRLPGRGRSGSSFRGRGCFRGRGGPSSTRTNGALSSSQLKSSDAEQAESFGKGEGPPSDPTQEEAKVEVVPQTTVPAQRNTTSRSARCDLCQVDCTSLEILEQHKSGKRHKKNLQKMEKLRITGEPAVEMHSSQTPAGGSNTDEYSKPQYLQQGNQNQQNLAETSNSVPGFQANQLAVEPVSAEPQCKATAEGPLVNPSGIRRPGMKRKMRDSHGGKRKKQKPHAPKVVIPLICDLCNVKCDTQEVFNRHISGKKHVSKLKRYEGHQATYGSAGLQVLYPPNPITQTLLNQGSQQGLHHLQPSPYPPPRAYLPPEPNHTAQDPNVQV